MQNNQTTQDKNYLLYLTLGALGIVFGDIGTSPLYAMKECFSGEHGIAVNPHNVYGILSLIIWALLLIVSVKYLTLVLRADNRGEGGLLALMALVSPRRKTVEIGYRRYIILLGLFGTALLYGDGIITPAISVLSAVEGLKVVTPLFEPYIVGITIVILVILFMIQAGGTSRIGSVFGPIIIIWFTTLGVLGVASIVNEPSVLLALDPRWGIEFLSREGWHGFIVLGSVFLAVTGTEALYADLGHFGRRPIVLAWYTIVLPGLVLNYFGQGALLLTNPASAEHPFYYLAPNWGLVPLVLLATSATIIASQALISGVFSLTRQAVQLEYLPRMNIRHTSIKEIGQIFIPPMNFAGLLATVLLILYFGSSSALAAAYGIAVASTMVITSILMYYLARYRWRWHPILSALVFGSFLLVDLAFLIANGAKILHGGWVTLVIAGFFFTIMTTWRRGREILSQRLKTATEPLPDFLKALEQEKIHRVSGTAVFMTRTIERTPAALIHNLKHNQVLHEAVILLMIVTEEQPHVTEAERVDFSALGQGFYAMLVYYGFMQTPDVPKVLRRCAEFGLQINPLETTYFLGREILLATSRKGMAIWRERLFAFMTQNAMRATSFFNIPPVQVIEIGLQVEL